MAKQKLTKQQREQVINALVSEELTTLSPWVESDRGLLNNADDDRLIHLFDKHQAQVEYETTLNALTDGREYVFNGDGFVPNLVHRGDTSNMEGEEGEENADDNEGDDQGTDQHEEASGGSKKVMNERIITRSGAKLKPEKQLTANEWLKTAPPEVRSVVQNAMANEARQKKQLIDVIVANERNNFTPEFLVTKDVQELQAIAALAGPVGNQQNDGRFLPDFSGAASPIVNQGQRTAAFNDQEDLLLLPTINFNTEKVEKQHQA